jgi:pyruvate/2-oxoglutarate/acetoin dehydrogenase E1 component
VAASVEKTGRCVIAHEGYPTRASRRNSRLGSPLERATLPSCERIAEAVRELARFLDL